MLKNDARASLAELFEAGIRLQPVDAVTIVREIALQVARSELPGVPSAQVIRLSSAGTISIEGPVPADGRSVPRAAQLLESLLPGFEASGRPRVNGALRLVIARAEGAIDLPGYPSLDAFADALARFAAPDPVIAVRGLWAAWNAAASVPRARPDSVEADRALPDPASPGVQPPPTPAEFLHHAAEGSATGGLPGPLVRVRPAALTISDIRRARRATGLALSEISARSRIPVPLLRQLEWGYLRNWPEGLYGRTQLVRYARASGLDEELVVTVVWPLVAEQAIPVRALAPERAARRVREESRPAVEVEKSPIAIEDLPIRRPDAADVEPVAVPSRRRAWALAALAIPALLVLALWPAVSVRLANWNQSAASALSRMTAPAGKAPAPAEAETRQARRDTPATPQRDDRSAAPRGNPANEPAKVGLASQAERAVGSSGSSPADGAEHPAAGLDNDGVADSPAFATVGSAMFYRPEAADGRDGLMRADTAAGGTVLRITRVVDDSSRNFHARPSPDGSRVAFDSDRDGVRAVYVADSNGENVRRVSGDGFAAIPSWSPDGRALAFVRAEPDKPRVWNLWTADLATGELHRLTDHATGQAWGGSWFPDGRRIAYSREDRAIVRDLETGREHVYPSPRKGRLVRTPAVSPDGRRLIFQLDRDGAWLLDLSDGSMQKILADPTAEQYTWSPDGRRVAYHSRRTGQWGVWVMTPR